MNYEKEILRVLYLAGSDGLSVRKISLHVHGACSTLFEPLDLREVQRDVSLWLQRNSRHVSAVVCRTGRRGVYSLNYSSVVARQLLLDFSVKKVSEAQADNPEEDKINNQLQLEF